MAPPPRPTTVVPTAPTAAAIGGLLISQISAAITAFLGARAQLHGPTSTGLVVTVKEASLATATAGVQRRKPGPNGSPENGGPARARGTAV